MNRLTISICLLAGVVFFGNRSNAQIYKPIEVQQKAIEAFRITGLETQATLTIYSASGKNRVRSMRTYSKLYAGGELEKTLIRFTAPADVRGTGFLSFDYLSKDDSKWIYMPALRKVRRIVSSENAKSFMGSEFSYADLSIPILEDFTYRLLPDTSVDGQLCYVLESTPKSKKIARGNGFSRKVAYIDRKTYAQRKVEYYNGAGEKEREVVGKDLVELDPKMHKFRFREITARNLKNGRRSVMRNVSMRFNSGIRDDLFSTRALRAGE